MSERSIDNIRQDWQNKFKEANGACFWEPDPINQLIGNIYQLYQF